MRHFPIYLDTRDKRIIISGAGKCAIAKLRLLLKTEAELVVFASDADPLVRQWANEGRLQLIERAIERDDFVDALVFYACNDDEDEDHRVATMSAHAHVKTLIVDNLDQSDFITPAIVDRAPVTVAIGTEGAAPVLARRLKADIEEMLPQNIGILARIGQAFRPFVNSLSLGQTRRAFWSRFYFEKGTKALAEGEQNVQKALHSLLDDMKNEEAQNLQNNKGHLHFKGHVHFRGHVHFVGAGPGDPELLTLKARKIIHDADIVIHDRLVTSEILELARREADIIEVGKIPFGASWKQKDINALLVRYGQKAKVVRLKSGDSGIFGRLDEEIEALDRADIAYDVIPGITSAAAAAAELKLSLTQRGRNKELRILTGHDTDGFTNQDWYSLAKSGTVAAIYMGKAAAGYFRGRLLMHGADPATPVTIVENVSRTNQKVIAATLTTLQEQLETVNGPAVLMLGLSSHKSLNIELQEAL